MNFSRIILHRAVYKLPFPLINMQMPLAIWFFPLGNHSIVNDVYQGCLAFLDEGRLVSS